MSGARPAGARPAESQTVSALLGIRQLILDRELAPGDRVSELVMVERLGVSRTPVRAALIRLEHEGLLTALSGGGFEVRGFSWQEMVDAIELRGVLEGTAARFAAERGVEPARIRELEDTLDALDTVLAADPLDMQAYIALNRAFHEAVLACARSSVLREQLERVVALPFAGPSAFVDTHGTSAEAKHSLVIAQSQHRAVLEAIALRQGMRAEMLMREHARIARRNLEIITRSGVPEGAVPGLHLIRNRE
ncbi:GntR family transcriptional regulator [Paroceanicella profunda]|uniref:GntR family transcriptional regulator n=1 Tax=Paroceanicella profunda TaxID=2579971 RepID=A0A5B8FZX2_9RHOB|nr:GntR family transcriptional regulator [Paroceanicella profunda]QDL92980.1 GntR family transcriptional regulator [Paroceanicella profunda]